MRSLGKKLILAILSWQVRRLQARNSFKIVAIVGSYGKTSTKFAIAHVLARHYRVRYQKGNYNDISSVPLIFFGEVLPNITDPIGWVKVLFRNEQQLRYPYPYDIVVVELGVDGPNQMAKFARYLQLDLTVVTSIALEHMDSFEDLEAVANEELAVERFSDRLLINADLCNESYTALLTKPIISYAADKQADYQIKLAKSKSDQYEYVIYKNNKKLLTNKCPKMAMAPLYSACAAAVIGDHFGMAADEIVTGIATIVPPNGRMQYMKGIRGSLILDETYNASPEAVKQALDVLYDLEAPQKIALLGNMNELGTYSERAHEEVGAYCNPAELDLLLTLGPHANRYLANAASERGCQVVKCTNPYEAGEYLKEHILDHAAILVKGSQNGVFTEEAVKIILANPEDSKLLVRQSVRWQKVKKKAWKDINI